MKFAVFDFETTGLTVHPKANLGQQPRAIEFGGIITDGVEILDQLEFLCNPGIALEEIITKITGLTNADLDNEPFFVEFIDALDSFFAGSDVAIAHNLSFDSAIMTYDCRRVGRELQNFPKIMCCTVEQTMHQFGRRMKLQDLYEMYCGPYVQKHRALDDVKLLHELCQKIGVYRAFN